MMLGHASHDELARILTASALALMGVLEITTPGCFGSIGQYFRGARAGLEPAQ